MTSLKIIETISEKYSKSPEEFIKLGSCLVMKGKKRALQLERLELLSLYDSETVKALEDKIKSGAVPEHPSWEALIEIKNIEAEIKEIENDIRTVQQA